MAEEYTTMRDLGFDFGPDPFGDKAAATAINAFIHRPGFSYLVGIVAAWVAYYVYVMLRESAERRDNLVIERGSRMQEALSRFAGLRELRDRDPGYEETLFVEHAKEIFLKVQDSMSRRQPGMARALVSDALYERLRDELDRTGAAGVRDRVTGLEFKNARALGYATGRHYDSVSVGFKVAALRERIDEKTGERLDGGSQEWEEIWTFLRQPSAKTLKTPGPVEGKCPACGAGLELTDAAKCGSCKAWINSGEYDWIAVGSTVPWEWHFVDPRRDVTGWNDLRENDEALNLEALEDRAAVAFWRWQAALRVGNNGPLRSLATPELLAALEGRAPAEALLGAVETVAFQKGPEFDEVHVQLRWEAVRERRTDYLIFQRKAGSITNWKAGLSATRCAGCGAALETGPSGTCAYCQEPVGWLLARIVPFGDWKRPDSAPATAVLPGLEWGNRVPAMEAVNALAVMIASDGLVHERERTYLIDYAARRGVPGDKAEAAIKAASLGEFGFNLYSENADGVLRGLIRMALADGFIEKGERDMIALAARRAGLHELEVKDMIRQEREALAARARELIARLD